MAKNHDSASGSLAPASAGRTPVATALACAADSAAAIDPLADVLRRVKLSGALFFLVDAGVPWRVDVPHGNVFASIILPRTQHVISYHIVTRGSCWAGLLGEEPVLLKTGDIIVIPHGDAYGIAITPNDPSKMDLATVLEFFRSMAAGELPFTIEEGDGGPGRLNLVCGFLGCDVRPFNPLLATLPRLLHVPRPLNADTDMLGKLIDLTLTESLQPRAGSEAIRLRLSELLFVEVVRRYIDTLPAEQNGWLAGLRDPMVGRALARLHEQLAHPWTLEELAAAVGVSRSTLADRFTHFVGQPPMQYLTQWRMQVAARLLADGTMKVSAVARDVGYASEAAFSRAFAKAAGSSPANWRRALLADRQPPDGH